MSAAPMVEPSRGIYCPSCHGQGHYTVELKGGWGASPRQREFRCRRCRGTGEAYCDLCEDQKATVHGGDSGDLLLCADCMEDQRDGEAAVGTGPLRKGKRDRDTHGRPPRHAAVR